MVQSNEVNLIVSAKDLASREFQKIERNLNKFKQQAEKTSATTKDTSMAMSGLSKATAAVGAVFAAAEFGRMGIELANLGESVRNTTNRFEDLVGGSLVAEASLRRMREATRGIADDASLMQGASDLLLMGIANSTTQAEQIVNLAIGLKRSTDSAADAVNNFAIMMGNQSYLRLDSFGISAGRTRMRVEELMKTAQAATREEAFTMAVLEIGQETMERTIDSIDRTSTAFKRVKTDITNAMQSIGIVVEGTVNGVAADLEWLVVSLAGNSRRLREIRDINSRIAIESANAATQVTREQRILLERALDSGALQDYENMLVEQAAIEQGLLEEYSKPPAIVAQNYQQYISLISSILGVERTAVADNATEIESILQSHFSKRYEMRQRFDTQMQILDERTAYEAQFKQNARLQTEIDNFEAAQALIQRLSVEGAVGDGIFNPALYSQIHSAQQYLTRTAEYFVQVNREGGAVTEKMANDYMQAANAAQRTTDQLWRQVEAFNNMNLSQLMGETGDVSLSEIGRMVTDSLGDTDLSDAFTNALDTLSGARTELTNFMENDIVPLIAEVARTKGPEAAAQFAQEIDNALAAAIALELGPGDTADLLAQILGIDVNVPQEDAKTVTVPFVPTWQDVARVTGAGTSTLETALGLKEGTITLSNAVTVDIPNLAFEDFATALGAEPGSALRSNLQFLIFGDNNAMSIDDEITINASRVTWGQIADWHGMSLQELISRLPPEAFGTGQPTPNTFALPGTYSIGGIGNLGAMGPGMPFAGRYSGGPFGNVDWSQPGSLFQQKLPKNELDVLVQRATDLESKLAEAAGTDFTSTNNQLTTVSSQTTKISDALDYITRSTWVIPVRVEFDASSVPENFRNSLERAIQDNGGVAPGTIRQGG